MSSPSLLPALDAAQSTQAQSPLLAVLVDGLTKRFAVRAVLRGISFGLETGKTLALFGANGAGKTTLLRVLATLTRPSSGSALVAGHDIVSEADSVRWIIGYVGHQPQLYADLTVRENLLFFARMYGLRDGPARTERLLTRVGLRSKGDDRVRTLSRGQAQRLALARGLLSQPTVLLLDEPDTGLDEEANTLLSEVVRERLEAGFTTVLTTHNVERGLSLSDDVLV